MCIYSFQILLPFRLLQNTEQSSGHHLVMWTHLGQPESRDPDHTCSRAGLHSVPWGTASASGSYSCPIFPITTGLLPPGQSTGPDPGQRERGSCYGQISEYPRCFLPPFFPTQREREERSCHFSELAPPSRGLASAPPVDTQHCGPGGAAQTRG